MSFLIELLPEAVPTEESEAPAQYGVITLGSFRERFVALTTFWNADDYRSHWRKAVARIVETGSDSCLITSLHDPTVSDMLFWWPMYRVGDRVRIQNGILLFEQLDEPFRLDNVFGFIPPRSTHSDDGEPISEWEVDTVALRAFLQL